MVFRFAADPASVTRRQIGWFLSGRLLTVVLFGAAAIAFQRQSPVPEGFSPLRWIFLLLVCYVVQGLLSFLVIRSRPRFDHYLQVQIAWDLTFSSFFVFLTGGIESPFAFLFILIILSAAAFFSQRQCLIVAAASAILYGSLIDLQYFGYLPLVLLGSGSSLPGVQTVLYAVYANLLAFFLTAFLGGLLAARLRRSEQALKRKEIDYEELDRLNRAIVANIGSGLLTINPSGRIRVFNQGAERITGFSLPEVYDREVRELFPGLAIIEEGFILSSRSEGSFVDAAGKRHVLGFATAHIAGVGEKEDNLLVSFQDLTRLKEIEERLRRNDRLAAVGQLAAGMAHEIRNPLASISGSVQLLIEGGAMSSSDERLMRIVVREADRLSLLLGDFLRFARPAPPRLEPLDLAGMFDELAAVVRADQRFAGVVIELNTAATPMRGDRDQIRQVVLNLLINAAEAMTGEGTIRLSCDGATIRVEDSGPGILPEIRSQLFNPFFTTKENGTGLGLATVHALVTAHGGTVEVEKSALGGAAFVVRLGVEDLRPTGTAKEFS